jgi:hypothetical protein
MTSKDVVIESRLWETLCPNNPISSTNNMQGEEREQRETY